MLNQIKRELYKIREAKSISDLALRQANTLYINGQCQLLTVAKNRFDLTVDDEFNDYKVLLRFEDQEFIPQCDCQVSEGHCHHSVSGLMEVSDYLRRSKLHQEQTGKKYTRQGMVKRVLAERRTKALKPEYRIEFADNPFGEHELTNEESVVYRLTFRDLTHENGYCSCPDYRTNKLGTCKHLMFAFSKLKEQKNIRKENQQYPFVEIFLDPLNDYQISWYYPHPLPPDVAPLIEEYFDGAKTIPTVNIGEFLGFIERATPFKQINIRPNVHTVVENHFEDRIMDQVREQNEPYFDNIKLDLFEYQKAGIEFATFRRNAIIADDMGLGKTLQAIGTALLKKDLFGFEKTLIICPASIKDQWKSEIERFSDEKAIIAEGFPLERETIYRESDAFFIILNYETVLRDLQALKKLAPDFIILDEAQRIKNYETLTANCIKELPKKHALVITGTPIENRLIDLYSIVGFLDPYMLAPLWEFSYQHCYFDLTKRNKITGYYNLKSLKERMKSILLRREKRDVLSQLPNISQIDIPIKMHPEQRYYHTSYAKGVAAIFKKKFITPYDLQKLMLLLSKMRMVCDSTYLVDGETDISPKMDELKHILIEKLDLLNSPRKVVIFSEWIKMNNIIGKMLRENDIGFTELNGKVPVKKRAMLIREFETNPESSVFLSTEAGGSGLNLQVADTVINFELPWNPAKKNQRIGRIDRLGQKSDNLTVINLITQGSIETNIASGLVVKQELFDSVLSDKSAVDSLDLSQKGRAQFLQQLESAIVELAEETLEEPDSEQDTAQTLELSKDIAQETEDLDKDKKVSDTKQGEESTQELEQVMNQGMNFLSGLMKIATGKDLGMESSAIKIDRGSGEVTMRFKLPTFDG